MSSTKSILRRWWHALPIELISWMAALVVLYCSAGHGHHFTLCPLENLGFEWCPGCGIGRAIGLFMHGEVMESFRMHWLGIPAFFVIVHRIYTLSKRIHFNRITYHQYEQPQYINDH
ncbi:DUF2752 domain-containing protein [Parapedobacter luteus]|uniref:DUF2752 domain-containing protein n=1 Tax=Parapedobacter luteus TaxID=623280 RepID=UPI0009A85C45|nr:DUF2752 domain-containing protein [Parapedobacter luteus]